MLHTLTTQKDIESFSISPENPTGEKGKGGMATEGCCSHFARELGQGWKVSPCICVAAGTTAVLADVKGQGAIKHIWVVDNSKAGRHLILRIYFDGQKNPAVCAPLSDFFAKADNQDQRQLSSLAMCINPRKGMNCYFEMPYRCGFRMEVENLAGTDCSVFYQIDCERKEIPENSLYFHAQFRHVNPLPYKEDYTILDNIKGNGHYVGTYLYWGVKSNRWWGEGEIKFYIDGDTDFPTICGTGTEDYFGGGWNFDVKGKYTEFSTPYTGMFKNDTASDIYRCMPYFDLYRWHIPDPIYFKKDLRVTIQALGWRASGNSAYRPLQDEISSVAYWYSDNLEDVYPPIPPLAQIELV